MTGHRLLVLVFVFAGSDIPGLSGLGAWDGSDVVTTRAYWADRAAERVR